MSKVEAEFYAEAIGGVADGFLMTGIIGIVTIVAVFAVGAILAFLRCR